MPFTDPLVLFRTAVDRLDACDFSGAARCCDPVSLRQHHRNELSRYAPEKQQRAMRIEDFMSGDPDMPREVAEYYVSQSRQTVELSSDVARELPGIPSVEALQNASADAVFAAFLDGRSSQRQLERLVAAGRIAPAEFDAALAMNPDRTHLIPRGFVEASPVIGYIIYQRDFTAGAVPPGPSDQRWIVEEQSRIASLPLDEQDLLRDMTNHYSPAIAICRRQPDSSWLLLADYNFLDRGNGTIIGTALEDSVDEDTISECS